MRSLGVKACAHLRLLMMQVTNGQVAHRDGLALCTLCELPVKIGPEGVMVAASPSSSPVPPMTVAHSPAPSDDWYLAMNTSFS